MSAPERDAEHAPTAPRQAEVVQFRAPNSLNAKVNYARKLAESGLLPAQYRQKPANVLFAVEYGEMLGLSPMAAITGIHVIDGKPTASAALISALVRRAGHKLRVTGNDREATARIIRSDDPDFVFESVWTLDRAKQAGLVGKDVWKKYPAAMLKARAITEAARDACEEALSGMHYTPEELGADVNEDGVPTTTVEVDWDAQIRDAGGDRARLEALWKTAPNDVVRGKIARAAEAAGHRKDNAEKPAPAPAADDATSEVVDAEIVDDDAPESAPVAPPADRRTPAQVASPLVDNLMMVDTPERAEKGVAAVSRSGAAEVDVSGLLTSDQRETLDVKDGEAVTLADLALLVSEWVGRHKRAVNETADAA